MRKTTARTGRCRFTRDDGYVLALVAIMLLPLLAFAGFGIDLGAWYGRATKIQRAADAAALAGVQELPILTSRGTTTGRRPLGESAARVRS